MKLDSKIISKIDHLPLHVLGEIAIEVNAARLQGRDIIDLSQLNPNLSPPGVAVEKLVQASLQPHNHRYSSSQGILKLREAFSFWYANRFNVELNYDMEIVVTLGTKQGLSHLFLAALNSGDNVILPTPAYPIHQASIILAGANIIDLPLFTKEELPLEMNALELTENSEGFFNRLINAYQKAINKPRFLLLSFPHNPSTTVATLGFFERLLKLAEDLDLLIVHDFAYADLAYDHFQTPSILQVPAAKERAVEFYSLSKGLCLPGWRIGVAVGNKELITMLKKVKSFLDYGAFQPLQIAAVKVLENYKNIISETVEIYKSRRNTLVQGLNNLSWNLAAPKGSLFVWARIPEKYKNITSKEFVSQLLENNVALCPGEGFGEEYKNFLRFALVEPESRIRQAITAIEKMSVENI